MCLFLAHDSKVFKSCKLASEAVGRPVICVSWAGPANTYPAWSGKVQAMHARCWMGTADHAVPCRHPTTRTRQGPPNHLGDILPKRTKINGFCPYGLGWQPIVWRMSSIITLLSETWGPDLKKYDINIPVINKLRKVDPGRPREPTGSPVLAQKKYVCVGCARINPQSLGNRCPPTRRRQCALVLD